VSSHRNVRGKPVVKRDDSVLAVVRAVAAVIVFVLMLAVLVLYFMPHETERLWAWTIRPAMTPLLMGAGYAAGAYFFVRAATTKSWRTISLGFLPITVFTSLLLLATVLHWENFNHGHVAFYSWTFLYAVTPALVPALWFLNRKKDPGREPYELLLSMSARAVLAAAGATIAAIAMLLFVAPDSATGLWPWQLSELTARTVSAYLALTGGSLLMMAWDGRWQASKTLLESLIIGTALIVIGVIRAWQELDPAPAVRWSYLTAMVAGLVTLVALYMSMERRARNATPRRIG